MNEAKKTLTMELIESIMDEKYTLVWVDYRESFNENRLFRFRMSTSEKPMAAQQKPLMVCSIVSQCGMRT